MKKNDTIAFFGIDKLIEATSRKKTVHDFHVFRSDELNKDKRSLGPTRTDHFVIILTTEGTAQLKLNLIDQYIQKNGLLIVAPNIIHEFIKETPNSFIGLAFIPEFLGHIGINKKHADAFTFFSSNSNPYFQLTEQEAGILLQMMSLLHQKDLTETAHPFKEEIIHHAFNLFMFELAAIAKNHRKNTHLIVTRKEEIMMSFFKILPDHFKEERSVQYYANQLFITSKHLTKTIKELTNKTCGELIDEMVILEAKVLLNDTTLSVANVADQLHFSDQFFFSKFFKNLTGLTPTAFKNKL